jgi:hypothetical protein
MARLDRLRRCALRGSGWTARERAPVDCVLPDDAVKRLEAATDFTAGFPTDFIATSLGIRRGVRAR